MCHRFAADRSRRGVQSPSLASARPAIPADIRQVWFFPRQSGPEKGRTGRGRNRQKRCRPEDFSRLRSGKTESQVPVLTSRLERRVPIRSGQRSAAIPGDGFRRTDGFPPIFRPAREKRRCFKWHGCCFGFCRKPEPIKTCLGRKVRMKTDFEIDFTGACPSLSEPVAGRHRRRKKRGVSGRSCRLCGKDPHPNYFYCPGCHHRISTAAAEDFGDFKGPE